MEIKIPHKNKLLHATVIKTMDASNDWLLFLSGGNTTLGKARYCNWQLQLHDKQINSVAFNYSGVAGSGDILERSSLQERISETLAVLHWIVEQSTQKPNLTIFASSMGGYIGLGAASAAPDYIEKIVLYAPAAYSKHAHDLKFDGSFTKEIRMPNSWETSRSFEWLKNINKTILMLTPGNDEIIPRLLTERYKDIGKENTSFTHIEINNCPHDCWEDGIDHQKQKDIIFHELLLAIDN